MLQRGRLWLCDRSSNSQAAVLSPPYKIAVAAPRRTCPWGRTTEVSSERDGQGAQLERLVPAVVERLPIILEEVAKRFTDEWPDYAAFLAEEQGEVSAAAEAFLRWLVTTAEQGLSHSLQEGVPQPEAQVALFEEIGRIQWREGRDLSTLLSAYQVGARVAWHHVSAIAVDTGVPPEALAALAEAVFVFVDQLSSASARGFVREQSAAAVTRERLRDELVDLLLSDRSSSSAVRAAAARAGWPLPREAAVILADPSNPVAQTVLSRLDSSCLPIRRRELLGAIVPDPQGPGRRQRLATMLGGARAVVGHAVPLEHLPASTHIAEIAARLLREGSLTDDPVFADEHLDAIIVHRDARLLAAFQRQCLAPLNGLAPAVRDRLSETLASWLRHLGDRQAVAAELHIHPQTVRYRLAQLHDLFGPGLDDPASRARLILALAWGSAVTPEAVP
jgi:PucR C-terminal helix-turn-helix domain